MLFPNCSNFPVQKLLPEFISKQTGAFLHRFEWTSSDRIGELPREWNWLVDEYPHNDEAKLLHFTLGIPAFAEYKNCDHAEQWWYEFHHAVELEG
jgi:hypothetical protein